MLFVGGATGFILLIITLWINLLVINRAKRMPPRAGSQRIVINYLFKMAGFLIVLGLATWYVGITFSTGILLGMVLGNIVFLVISRKNQAFVERLVNRPEKQG
ncbi:MAG: hypothetical protein ACM3QW_08640 [Ignavibacteriales bacterium]